jgi:hypothetical protein
MAFLRKIAPPSSLAASVEIGKNVIIDLKVRLKVVKSQPTREQPLPAAVRAEESAGRDGHCRPMLDSRPASFEAL